jgi:hypothetical protein
MRLWDVDMVTVANVPERLGEGAGGQSAGSTKTSRQYLGYEKGGFIV